MNVQLIRYTQAPDELCGEAALLCTGRAGDPLKALRGALNRGHESVAEHAAFTFRIEGVSRVLLAQLTRHRHASFSVQSQRYCGVGEEKVLPPSFIEPASFMLMDSIMEINGAVSALFADAERLGIPIEDARYFVPQAVQTKLIMTANARELRHIFELRCCNKAQWEIRELADGMLAECRKVAPVLFEQAGAPCQQGRSCPEGAYSCGKPREAMP